MAVFRESVRSLVARGLLLKERVRSGVVWNPLDSGFHQDPYPGYQRLRERDPIHRSELISGWVFSRHADCDAILRDHRRFSNDQRKANAEVAASGVQLQQTPSMLRLDPPDHTRLRALVSPTFTPGALRAWRRPIEEIVDRLLDEAAGRPEIDVLSALAVPLPTMAIALMLGVPPRDLEQFKAWSDDVARTLEPTITAAQVEAAGRSSAELKDYFEVIVNERRAEPQDDLISALIEAEEEGDKLTHEEVLVTLQLILVAGNETTTNLIANGMLALVEHPDQLDRLRREPELIDSAIEELLRWDSPVQTDRRIALEEVDWDGVRIKRGDPIVLLLGSANRDPEEFPDPDRLDLGRGSKRHMSFGRGIHHCLGAPLARMKAEVAFTRLLERYDSFELAARPRFKDHIVLRGMNDLPLRVTAGAAARSGAPV